MGPAQQQRDCGSHGAKGNHGGNVGGKRKTDGNNQPDSKHHQISNQAKWGSQPIVQQPLQQGGDYSGMTMGTVMTTMNFIILILMGNSGSRQVRA